MGSQRVRHDWVTFNLQIWKPLSPSHLMAQTVENLPAVHKTRVWSLDQEDPLEKEIVAHFLLSWRIPWTEEPARLQFMELQRAGQDWVTNTVCIWCEKMFQSNSLHAAVQVFQYHLWRRLSFLHCIFLRMLPLAIVQVPKLHEDGSSFVWDLVLYLFIWLLENGCQARRTLHSALLQLAKTLHTSLPGKSAKKLYGGVK